MTDPDDAAWLDPDEQALWQVLAMVTLRLPTVLDAQLRRDAGLTLFEYTVLARLSEAPHRRHQMSELATVTSASLPRLSQVLTRLELRDLVERERDRGDARSVIVMLTEAGMAKVVASAPGHTRTVRELVMDPLTKDQQRRARTALSAVLRAVQDHA